jgi:hypothetical protein
VIHDRATRSAGGSRQHPMIPVPLPIVHVPNEPIPAIVVAIASGLAASLAWGFSRQIFGDLADDTQVVFTPQKSVMPSQPFRAVR